MQHSSCLRAALALAALVVVSVVSPSAHAFERQWHFGGGGGIVTASDGYELGPALGLHAAYGVSDVFDVRLELLGARSARAAVTLTFYAAKVGLAYKLDIIEWIPYFGVTTGFLGVTEPVAPFSRAQATLGLIGGLDWAVTRHFGLGLAGMLDYTLSEPASCAAALLRAEYQFGW